MNKNNNPIKFYHRGQNYFEFTNFAEGYPINFPSLPGYENLAGNWPTAEHAFQAAKFLNDEAIVNRFRGLATAREAFVLADNLTWERNGETKTKITDNWHGKGSGSWEEDGSNAKKIEIMRLIVRQKFFQHDYLKNLLWKTGTRDIIEDTANDTSRSENKRDNCWGNATKNGKSGKNWLGKILMEIRQEINAEKGGEYKEGDENESEMKEKKEKQKLVNQSISEIKIKLQEAKNITKKECNELGNVWETNFRMWADAESPSEADIEEAKRERLEAIEEWIAKKKNPKILNDNQNDPEPEKNGPPKNSEEPTPEQVNDTKDKLDEARKSNDKAKIITALKKAQQMAKNSLDEDLKKKKEQLEDCLGEIDKSELRKLSRIEVEEELNDLGIEPNILVPAVKQKYEDLKINDSLGTVQIKDHRTQILESATLQCLEKIITELQQAFLKNNNQKAQVLTNKIKTFTESKNDYKQRAYKLKKNEVQALLEKGKTSTDSVKSQQPEGFFRTNNPLMWLSGVGIIALSLATILAVRSHRGKKRLKTNQ